MTPRCKFPKELAKKTSRDGAAGHDACDERPVSVPDEQAAMGLLETTVADRSCNGFDQLDVQRWFRQHQQDEFDRLDLDFP